MACQGKERDSIAFFDDITHIYPYLLSNLQRQFIRIKSRLASPEGRWDPVALPTVIAYRGGETVASLVRVSDDIGADPSVETLESYLSSNISNFDANDSAKLYWRPSK